MDGIMDTITGPARFRSTDRLHAAAMTTAPTTIPYRNTGIYTLDGGCFYPPRD